MNPLLKKSLNWSSLVPARAFLWMIGPDPVELRDVTHASNVHEDLIAAELQGPPGSGTFHASTHAT